MIIDTVIPQTTDVDGTTIESNSGVLSLGDDWQERLANQQLKQSINILINSAASTSTLKDYDDMYLDLFTDADGALGTIDTTNTTANFDAGSSQYKNGGTESITIPSSTNSDSLDLTMTLKANATGYISKLKFWIHSASTTVQATIIQDGVTLAQKSITGMNLQTLTFVEADYTGGLIDKDTASGAFTVRLLKTAGTGKFGSQVEQTSHSGLISWTNQNMQYVQYGTDTTEGIVFVSTFMSTVVQTNAEAITANPLAHQVYTDYTGTAPTYDISFDGGITWVTGQTINTKNSSVHNGDSMIIKINLGDDEAEQAIDDYAVMLYYL